MRDQASGKAQRLTSAIMRLLGTGVKLRILSFLQVECNQNSTVWTCDPGAACGGRKSVLHQRTPAYGFQQQLTRRARAHHPDSPGHAYDQKTPNSNEKRKAIASALRAPPSVRTNRYHPGGGFATSGSWLPRSYASLEIGAVNFQLFPPAIAICLPGSSPKALPLELPVFHFCNNGCSASSASTSASPSPCTCTACSTRCPENVKFVGGRTR